MQYSKKTADQIAKLIEDGNFAKTAYHACGVSHQSFYRWLKEKPEFKKQIDKAQNQRIVTLIGAIKIDKSWQSKAWMLERLLRSKYHLQTANEKEMQGRLDVIEEKLNKVLKDKDKK